MQNELKKNIRLLVNNILKGENGDVPKTFEGLAKKVAENFRAKDGSWEPTSVLTAHTFKILPNAPSLNDDEEKSLMEVYWDLFREKQITFGCDEKLRVTDFSIHSESKELGRA